MKKLQFTVKQEDFGDIEETFGVYQREEVLYFDQDKIDTEVSKTLIGLAPPDDTERFPSCKVSL